MQDINNRTEIAQRKYIREEERGFYSRAHADVVMGLWAAKRLGMNEQDAKIYAASVMEEGVTSSGGRGGFDRIVHDLAPLRIDADALRSRYAAAMGAYRTGTA